jgi:hypothetical protein
MCLPKFFLKSLPEFLTKRDETTWTITQEGDLNGLNKISSFKDGGALLATDEAPDERWSRSRGHLATDPVVANLAPTNPPPALPHAENKISMAADGPPRRHVRPIITTVACISDSKTLKSYNYQNIHPN